MEHGTNTAFVSVQLGRALGAGAEDLEAVFYGALVKDAGCRACGAVLHRFFADDEPVPRLARWFAVVVVGLNAIDMMFFIPAYPFWALVIIAVDVVAPYGLCAYGSRQNLERRLAAQCPDRS